MKKIFSAAIIFLLNLNSVQAQEIIDKPLPINENRIRLTQEYSMKHYGFSQAEIIPQAVIIHWTAGSTWESAYKTFYDDIRADGEVNVSSQFIVDRDGAIYRLTPENFMCRHAIGYNWCAIGIENVGGIDNVEDLTEAQLSANIYLINYLREKFPTIKYIFGHYQQNIARESNLYIEHVPNYYSIKTDPGKIFMGKIHNAFKNSDLRFFPL